MRPIDFEGANWNMGPPKDMTEGQCGTLRVRKADTVFGMRFESMWKPDAEELAALNAGACVKLDSYGMHAPVWVGVEDAKEIP